MKLFSIIIVTFSLLLVSCEKKAEVKEKVETIGPQIVEEHRCANCGMSTDKYPNWEQKVLSRDKGIMYFDGSRCMFKILLDSATTPQKIEQILVKDYYSLDYIDGKAAFYVIGSDVLGPMGKELIPFKDEKAAQEFLTDHQGEKIVRFEDVDIKLIMKLIGKMHMQ